MQLQLSTAASVRLQAENGQVFTLPRVDELSLEALKGAFWVTSGALSSDHVLRPGERLRLMNSRQVVVEALEPGVIQFFLPANPPLDVEPAEPARAGTRWGTAHPPAGREPACMRNHVQRERLQFRSLEFA